MVRLTFGGITYLLTSGWPTNERLMMSGGVVGGFFSHLLLDEIYAVEFKTGRWRTKKSFGTAMAEDLNFVAENVTGEVVPNSGHWLMEEQPAATIAAIKAFIEAKK